MAESEAALTASRTFVSAFQEHAKQSPTRLAVAYLGEDGAIKAQYSYRELDVQARAIGARLQGLDLSGECAVLLYPPGLEFISAFLGCLYASVVAVPLPVPRLKASMTQFEGIIKDLRAETVLTTSTSLTRLNRLDTGVLSSVMCLPTDTTEMELAGSWDAPTLDSETLAYLQYTSGSTSDRKGVMITHRNVVDNLDGIAERFNHHAASVSVNWLPHFHDLGLVSGILQPLYHGHPNYLLSATAFVQKPIRWLQAISDFRGTYTNSPNYGYELCARRINSDTRKTLDLSSWDVALNGAEPVRSDTVHAFVDAFSTCGFKATAMYPAYGLAEATLVVAGPSRGDPLNVIEVEAEALERNEIKAPSPSSAARTLVGCGKALQRTEIAIVDPENHTRVKENTIGEIWVNGPGVAGGYWQREEETKTDFQGTIQEGGATHYLRTGDLGFLQDGHLFVTGRLKDLIIIRGSNHYPQDIEWTIEQLDARIRKGCAAAFSIEDGSTEQLIVVAELERDAMRDVDVADLGRAARNAVAEAHDIHLRALVLLKTGTVPRTSSGKIQRRRCRSEYLNGALAIIGEDNAADSDSRISQPTLSQTAKVGESNHEMPDLENTILWLQSYARERLNSQLEDSRRSISPPTLLDFGNNGILGLQVPCEYGGKGFSYTDALSVISQLGTIDQTLTMMTIVHNTLGIRPIMNFATDTFRDEILPELATGRSLAAFAMTEPNTGSNPQAIETTSVRSESGDWLLTGNKSWSGSAGWASVINVFAQNTDRDGRHRGINGFAVARSASGLKVGDEALTLGMRGMVQNSLELDHVALNDAYRLGDIGAGMTVAQDAMMQGRLAIAAACVGGMKRCISLMLRYAERRTIATGLLRDNPLFVQRLGANAAVTTALEIIVQSLGERLDGAEDVPPDAYVVCKTIGPEWFWRTADDLVQFLGGRGYIESNIAPRMLRDARVTRILEGPTEAMVTFLGSRVMSAGASYRTFLADVLAAPQIAARLEQAVTEITERNQQGPFTGADARRFSAALVGQVASDAAIAAALSHSSGTAVGEHHARWAHAHFEQSVATALRESGNQTSSLTGSDIDEIGESYRSFIGDIEQTASGEDFRLDPMLSASPDGQAHSAKRNVNLFNNTVGGDEHTPPRSAPSNKDREQIKQFVIDWMASELKVSAQSIRTVQSFFDYGMDSVTTVMLTVSLEEWLELELFPELVYDFPVIDDFIVELVRLADS